MSARCVMVLGTSSGAGKSWLATALCRHYAARGFKVAPFKAQNMSNNGAAITLADGGVGEISAAQVLQALAARAVPDARMNPLLLKPDSNTHSRAVLLGHEVPELSACAWRERSARVWPAIADALDSLRAENDVLVLEGAGSPAEINLMAHDVVNLRVAQHANARCLLVTDIDRGGAFAHLYGTWALLPADARARIAGFVLNRFRGDAALLAPAPATLQERTGVPTLAVVPMLEDQLLPEEDGWYGGGAAPAAEAALRVALLAWPHGAHLDTLQALRALPGVAVALVRGPDPWPAADLLVVPASSAPAADLDWLRRTGVAQRIATHAQGGGRILALGSGAALLAQDWIDARDAPVQAPQAGLALLPDSASIRGAANTPTAPRRLPALQPPWDALGALEIDGPTSEYATFTPRGMQDRPSAADPSQFDIAAQSADGLVLGCGAHALLQSAAVQRALFGAVVPPLDSVFDALAAAVESAFAPDTLEELIR